ncbi:MAG: hypothetical protein NC078_06470 [Ruminococcus sp.]|nr:hypothetical protein [Ruminococcus sp.]
MSKEKNICPSCGGKMVRGLCLDCGNSAPREKKAPLPRSAVYQNNAQPLTGVTAPELFTLTGEDIVIPQKVTASKSFANPYFGVIPFETPDFGENYAVPQAVIREYGTPKGIRIDDSGEELATRKMKISQGRHIADYWWIIMLSLMLPWQVSWLAAPALFKFDEKGGRRAAVVILIMTVVKFLIKRIVW